MSRRVVRIWCWVLAVSTLATGCQPTRPFFLRDDGDLSHYKGVATEMEYPDVETARLAEVSEARAPLMITDHEHMEYWDLSLEESVQTALANSKVIRTLSDVNLISSSGGVLNGSSQLQSTGILATPQQRSTTYTPSIVESDPRFGTEAALSAFDAQLSSSMVWNRNHRANNFFFQQFQFQPSIFNQDLAQNTNEISKRTATGGQAFIRTHNNYEYNNNPTNRFPSAYNVDVEAEFRHPLLQGSGVNFNRIAGPNNVAGFYNGVTIARLNHDIQLGDLEANVRNVINDVEIQYWRLSLDYRTLDARVTGRNSALQTWRKIKALADNGAVGGEAAKEAQAREQYFQFRAQVESALSDVYTSESRLRYMLGIAPTDGRLIRPIDAPVAARVQFDWNEVLTEALARSPELRQQKFRVKQHELQLSAAKNFLLPRLDTVGLYRWRGFGDDLFVNKNPGDPLFPSAYRSLTANKFQEWQVGLQLTVPIGFRQAHAAVRNEELQLAQERARLQEQELALTHLLTDSVRNSDRFYVLSQTNFNRRVAAQHQVDAVKAAYETQTETLDVLLDAQRRLADAEIAYFDSMINYTVSITQVHFRKGSLLEYNGVYMAEGPWAGKAYFDARKRARERDAGFYMDYGFTRPAEFSRGPIDQRWGPQSRGRSAGPINDPSEPGRGVVPRGEPVPAGPKSDDPSNSGSAGAAESAQAAPATPPQGQFTGPIAPSFDDAATSPLIRPVSYLGPPAVRDAADDRRRSYPRTNSPQSDPEVPSPSER